MTPLRAIREKCLDCCAGLASEVKLCPCINCTLHPYRLGRNPALAGKGKISNLRPKKPTGVGDSGHEGNTEGHDTHGKRAAAIFTGKMGGVEIRKEN